MYFLNLGVKGLNSFFSKVTASLGVIMIIKFLPALRDFSDICHLCSGMNVSRETKMCGFLVHTLR